MQFIFILINLNFKIWKSFDAIFSGDAGLNYNIIDSYKILLVQGFFNGLKY